MTKKISKNVLEKIKKEKLKPAPKWEFLLKKSFLWTLLVIVLILGGLMASVVIFHLNTGDWIFYQHQDKPFLRYVFEVLPYFWLLLFVLVIFVAYYDFKHTDKGYKYPLWIIFSAAIGICILIGSIFFGTGVGKRFENQMIQKVPFYREMSHEKDLKKWNQPEEGFLAGELVHFVKEGEIELESFDGKKWTVVFGKIDKPPIPPLEEGCILKTLGEQVDDNIFKAEVIMPWEKNLVKKPFRKQIFLHR
ncbi:hypothetical protein ACFL21_00900 [Patescibacteria group bacterium]